MNFNKLWPKPAKADTAEVHSAPGILDVVWLSLKLSFTHSALAAVNLLFLLYSLPILTDHRENRDVQHGCPIVRDPGDSRTEINESMKTGLSYTKRPFFAVVIMW